MSSIVNSGHALVSLLRAAGGTPDERIARALHVVVEHLRMDVAYVAQLVDGRRVVTHCASSPGQSEPAEALARSAEEALGGVTTTGPLPSVSGQTSAVPASRRGVGSPIRSHAVATLVVDDEVVGSVCCASRTPQPRLDDRDREQLVAVAAHVGELLGAGDASPVELSQVAFAVAASKDVEGMTRPLLQVLAQVTGLESTYLTLIDWEADQQTLALVLNTGDLEVPEGLRVPWADSLCRRAFDEQRMVTRDVPAVWGDSEAARALGLITYVSVPVLASDCEVVGTLCAASTQLLDVDQRHLTTMQMFARLVAGQLAADANHTAERARSAALAERTKDLRRLAEHDSLTGLLNRAGVEGWLAQAIVGLDPAAEQIAVAFVDVDGLKPVNDVLGHAAGDEVLRRLATALACTGRASDMHGRIGGDEFVVASVLPASSAALGGWSSRLRRAAVCELDGRQIRASVGVVAVTTTDESPAEVLHRADEAMYVAKRAARAGRSAARD